MSEDRLHIANLSLSKRTYNLLAKAGLMYVEQLQSATNEELRAIHGFGADSLAEVRKALVDRARREKYHTQDLPPIAEGGDASVEHADGYDRRYPHYSGPFIYIGGGYGSYDIDTVSLDPQQALALLAWLKQEEATLQQLMEKLESRV